MLKKDCTHPEYAQEVGPEYPLFKRGFSPTLVCTLCEAFTLTAPGQSRWWNAGPIEQSIERLAPQEVASA